MIPEIIAPEPDENGNYCAGRRYKWEGVCEQAALAQWFAIELPDGVEFGDIIQTNPNGLVNWMTFPIAGRYCFRIVCGEPR